MIALGAAVTANAYRQDIRAARERIAQGSQIAQTSCGPIEYASLGNGPPMVLLVHGAGGGFDQGLEVAQPFVEANYRVVLPSRFGYLRTPLPADASPEAQADAHACLLDALGIDRVAVFGVSAGGPSAMQLAIRHPGRASALILMAPMAYAPGGPEIANRASASLLFIMETVLGSDFLFWAGIRAAHDLMAQVILGTPPEVLAAASTTDRERAERVLAGILPVSLRRRGLLNESAVAASLTRYDLEHIGVPTLTISAKDDGYRTYEGARYTAEHVANGHFLGFETGGHLLVGHNDEVATAMLSFLRTSALPVEPGGR